MKKILIGLLILGSFSSFANCVSETRFNIDENVVIRHLSNNSEEAIYATEELELSCSDTILEILKDDNNSAYSVLMNYSDEIPVVFEINIYLLNFKARHKLLTKISDGRVRAKILDRSNFRFTAKKHKNVNLNY